MNSSLALAQFLVQMCEPARLQASYLAQVLGGTFIMGKCPFCGADTRPGDNFCLNCGNRLLATTPSSSAQAQPSSSVGDATIAATEGWGGIPDMEGGTVATNPSWGAENNNSWGAEGNNAAPQPWENGGNNSWGAEGNNAAQPWENGGNNSWGNEATNNVQPSISEAPTAAPATPSDKIERPARFILRSDAGETLQEYPLDKLEITIGRAPNSDILLSKDKLTSRRHATVHYEGGQYVLRDERSANGTFVNGQQIEDMAPHVLRDSDHVGIGEHELLFREFGAESQPSNVDVAELATISIPNPPEPQTWRTYPDEQATLSTPDDKYSSDDKYSTKSMADGSLEIPSSPAPVEPAPAAPVETSFAAPTSAPATFEKSSPVAPETPTPAVMTPASEAGITFSRITSLPQPSLPDIGALVAALSALDGQVTSLQNQLNATQEAMRNHEAEVGQTANQLRSGVRHVSELMDSTIADVARSREALAWSELLQLMEDVMSNPRDIEYVTKLARKARELNKVFQLHQIVLSTMAQCNSLLRGMIGDGTGQD
jgi:pSer/pThr/pTyr-binding forkhead associated (FHA) protein